MLIGTEYFLGRDAFSKKMAGQTKVFSWFKPQEVVSMRPVSAGDESGKLVKLLLEVPFSRLGAVLARIADLAARNNLVINIDGNKPAAKVFASEGMARKTLGLGPAVPGREASRKRGSGADTGALKEELARLADELVSSATAQKEANDMIGAQT